MAGLALFRGVEVLHVALLAATRVMQAGAEDLIHVQVHHQQILLEGFRAREQTALAVEDHAAAVEDQLILPADEIHVGDDAAGVGGARGKHTLARGLLAHVEGGGAEVEQHLGAGICLDRRRAAGIPDILADVDADDHAVDHEDRRALAGLEVAVLVEDAIGRQEALAVDALELAVTQHGRGIVEVGRAVDEADDEGEAGPLGRGVGELAHDAQVVADETRLEQQVFGRVAGDAPAPGRRRRWRPWR